MSDLASLPTFEQEFGLKPGEAVVPQKQAPLFSEEGITPTYSPDSPQAEGVLGTIGREFGSKIAPAAGTAGGAAAGAAAGAQIGLLGGPAAEVTVPLGALIGSIVGGVAGGTGTAAIQKKVMGEQWTKSNEAQLALNAQAHPIASQFGSMVPFLVSVFGGEGAGLVNAEGRTIGRYLTQGGKEALAAGEAAPYMEHALQSAAQFGRASASEASQQKYVEGKDVSVLDAAAKGALSGLAVGAVPWAKAADAFPMAKTLLDSALGGAAARSVTDSAAMTLANSLYDTAVHGKPFDLQKTADEFKGDVPAFMLQNLLLGAVHKGMAARQEAASSVDTTSQVAAGAVDNAAANGAPETAKALADNLNLSQDQADKALNEALVHALAPEKDAAPIIQPKGGEQPNGQSQNETNAGSGAGQGIASRGAENASDGQRPNAQGNERSPGEIAGQRNDEGLLTPPEPAGTGAEQSVPAPEAGKPTPEDIHAQRVAAVVDALKDKDTMYLSEVQKAIASKFGNGSPQFVGATNKAALRQIASDAAKETGHEDLNGNGFRKPKPAEEISQAPAQNNGPALDAGDEVNHPWGNAVVTAPVNKKTGRLTIEFTDGARKGGTLEVFPAALKEGRTEPKPAPEEAKPAPEEAKPAPAEEPISQTLSASDKEPVAVADTDRTQKPASGIATPEAGAGAPAEHAGFPVEDKAKFAAANTKILDRITWLKGKLDGFAGKPTDAEGRVVNADGKPNKYWAKHTEELRTLLGESGLKTPETAAMKFPAEPVGEGSKLVDNKHRATKGVFRSIIDEKGNVRPHFSNNPTEVALHLNEGNKVVVPEGMREQVHPDIQFNKETGEVLSAAHAKYPEHPISAPGQLDKRLKADTEVQKRSEAQPEGEDPHEAFLKNAEWVFGENKEVTKEQRNFLQKVHEILWKLVTPVTSDEKVLESGREATFSSFVNQIREAKAGDAILDKYSLSDKEIEEGSKNATVKGFVAKRFQDRVKEALAKNDKTATASLDKQVGDGSATLHDYLADAAQNETLPAAQEKEVEHAEEAKPSKAVDKDAARKEALAALPEELRAKFEEAAAKQARGEELTKEDRKALKDALKAQTAKAEQEALDEKIYGDLTYRQAIEIQKKISPNLPDQDILHDLKGWVEDMGPEEVAASLQRIKDGKANYSLERQSLVLPVDRETGLRHLAALGIEPGKEIDVKATLKKIAESPNLRYTRLVARALLKSSEFSNKIQSEAIFAPNSGFAGLHEHLDAEKTDRVTFNLAKINAQSEAAYVFLHELLHSFTAATIDAPMSEAKRKAVGELQDLYVRVKAQMNKDGVDFHAGKNLHEFLVGSLMDSNMIRYLDAKDGALRGKKPGAISFLQNLYAKFMSWVTGKKVDPGSALAEAVVKSMAVFKEAVAGRKAGEEEMRFGGERPAEIPSKERQSESLIGSGAYKMLSPDVQKHLEEYQKDTQIPKEVVDKAKAIIDEAGDNLHKAVSHALSIKESDRDLSSAVMFGSALKAKELRDAAEKAGDLTKAKEMADIEFKAADSAQEQGSKAGFHLAMFKQWTKLFNPAYTVLNYTRKLTKGQKDILGKDEGAQAVKGAVESGRTEGAKAAAETASKTVRSVAEKMAKTKPGMDNAQAVFDFFQDLKNEGSLSPELTKRITEWLAQRLSPKEKLPAEAIKLVEKEVKAQLDAALKPTEVETDRSKPSDSIRQLNELAPFIDKMGEVFSEAKRRVIEFKDMSASQRLALEKASFDAASMKSVGDIIRKAANLKEEIYKSLAERESNKTALVDAVRSQLDVPQAQAEKIADAVKNAYEVQARKMAKAKLDQLVKEKKAPALKQSEADRLIRFANLGAFDEEKFYNALAPKFGLPAYNEAKAEEFYKEAQRIQSISGNEARYEATRKLLQNISEAHIAELKGRAKLEHYLGEVAPSVWIAGVLSGVPTHTVNFFNTQFNVLNSGLARATGHVISDFKEGKGFQPGYYADLLNGWLDGARSGWSEAQRSVGTGFNRYRSIRQEGFGVLEKHKMLKPWAIVSRLLAAEDAFNSSQAENIAYRMAVRSAMLDHPELAREVMDAFDERSVLRQNAKAQAEKEASEGKLDQKAWIGKPNIAKLRQDAIRVRTNEILAGTNEITRAAARTAQDTSLDWTYNNDPKGVVGMIIDHTLIYFSKNPATRPLGVFVTSFMKTMSNLINNGIDYSPLGALQAFNLSPSQWALKEGNKYRIPSIEKGSTEFYETLSRAAMGSAMVAAIVLKAQHHWEEEEDKGKVPYFAIYGGASQLDSYQRQQLLASGQWSPFTIKIGDKRVRYSDLPGINFMLGGLGEYYDAMRFKKTSDRMEPSERVARAAMGAVTAIMDKNLFQGLNNMLDAIRYGNDNRGVNALKNLGTSIVGGYTNPAVGRWLHDTFAMDENGEVTKVAMDGWENTLRALTPLYVGANKPRVDVLGDPIHVPWYNATASRFFETQKEPQPIFGKFFSAGVMLRSPDKATEYGIPHPAPNGKGKPIKDRVGDDQDTWERYIQLRGQALKQMLTPQAVDQITKVAYRNRDDGQALLDKYANIARQRAVAELTREQRK